MPRDGIGSNLVIRTRLRLKPRPSLANEARDQVGWHWLALAGTGQRSREVERATGIEYIAPVLRVIFVKNKAIAANARQCGRRLSLATDIQSTLPRRSTT
jgi:hypothetical protein